MRILAAAAASVVVLSGCGSSAESTTPPPEATEAPEVTRAAEPTPDPTPTKEAPPADGGSYSSLTELQDAYVAAGGECAELDQANQITLAAESGHCSDDTVLSTYLSRENISQLIQTNKDLNESIDHESDSVWLVGQNWIVNGPDVETLQEEMGGQLVSF